MKFFPPNSVGFAVVSLFLVGCQPKNEFVEPPPPEVTVAKPLRMDVTVMNGFPGRTQAKESIEIRARVSGYLKSIEFADGELVKEGQPLFVIEPEPYIARVKAAEAELDSAKASLEIAKTNYERRRQAFETKAVSEIDLLTAKANLDSAEALVLAAEAGLTQAIISLSYTTNTAPATGRIGRKQVSVGNLVGGAEPTLLTTLVVQDPMDVYFNISERAVIPKLAELGQMEGPDDGERLTVGLELADGSRYAHAGQVDYLDNRADPETGTVTVRAEFPNPDGALLPGLYGKILVPSRREQAVLVPDLAVQRDLAGTYVLAVDEGNQVAAQYVALGEKVGDARIISDGLDGTERVVINGIQRARPGIEVTPLPGEIKPPASEEVVQEP